MLTVKEQLFFFSSKKGEVYLELLGRFYPTIVLVIKIRISLGIQILQR
jgi:hypothetical protein